MLIFPTSRRNDESRRTNNRVRPEVETYVNVTMANNSISLPHMDLHTSRFARGHERVCPGNRRSNVRVTIAPRSDTSCRLFMMEFTFCNSSRIPIAELFDEGDEGTVISQCIDEMHFHLIWRS